MAVPSSSPLLRLLAIVVAATALPGVPRQVLGQVQKGSLERLAQPAADTGVVNLRVCFALCTAPQCGDSRVVLRRFERGGRRLALVLDPDSLDTEIAPLERLPVECSPWTGVRAALAGTRYALALADAERNETGLQDAGIVHAMPRGKGVVLTVDLCPSRRPLDRSLFDAVIAEFGPEERPVPLAVAVTGVWMEEHPDDVAWLLERVRRGDASITWIDHSFSHRFEPGTPLTRNFLLEPGTNAETEILRAEEAMLERGIVPSVFFRFPGLVSSRELFDRVVAHGLVPVGSDAWLAKGQRPTEGSIVLVHGNGNEPIGVEDFLRLLRAERGNIRDRDWLLVDLRQSAVPEGIN